MFADELARIGSGNSLSVFHLRRRWAGITKAERLSLFARMRWAELGLSWMEGTWEDDPHRSIVPELLEVLIREYPVVLDRARLAELTRKIKNGEPNDNEWSDTVSTYRPRPGREPKENGGRRIGSGRKTSPRWNALRETYSALKPGEYSLVPVSVFNGNGEKTKPAQAAWQVLGKTAPAGEYYSYQSGEYLYIGKRA